MYSESSEGPRNVRDVEILQVTEQEVFSPKVPDVGIGAEESVPLVTLPLTPTPIVAEYSVLSVVSEPRATEMMKSVRKRP